MKLEIGNNQGHVIIDDTSGKIMSVVVVRAVEGNSDFIATTSFTNNHDGTHTDLINIKGFYKDLFSKRQYFYLC